MWIVTPIAVILATKFLLNAYKLWQVHRYRKWYEIWLRDRAWDLVQHKSTVKKLFVDAGVIDGQVTVIERLGYGHAQQYRASVIDNFPNDREDIARLTMTKFHNATGVYRTRMLETFNPFFWIEFAIFLPRETLKYLGVEPDKAVVKMAQVLYWIFSTAFGVLLKYHNEILGLFNSHDFNVGGSNVSRRKRWIRLLSQVGVVVGTGIVGGSEKISTIRRERRRDLIWWSCTRPPSLFIKPEQFSFHSKMALFKRI